MNALLESESLTKTYHGNHGSLEVLKGISFSLQAGETAAIVGPSGSGKSTLLSLCAGLDTPTSGSLKFQGQSFGQLSEDMRAQMRIDHMGFIFQSFHLMASLTALENVLLPMELKGVPDRNQAKALLDAVGLGARMHHYPSQLSGGECQRVGVARAFANKPAILFADEPTGNLDRETSSRIESLIFDLNQAQQTTLLLITHDLELASKAQRRFDLHDGLLIEKQPLVTAQAEAGSRG